jgi:hypothetical protein
MHIARGVLEPHHAFGRSAPLFRIPGRNVRVQMMVVAAGREQDRHIHFRHGSRQIQTGEFVVHGFERYGVGMNGSPARSRAGPPTR